MTYIINICFSQHIVEGHVALRFLSELIEPDFDDCIVKANQFNLSNSTFIWCVARF